MAHICARSVGKCCNVVASLACLLIFLPMVGQVQGRSPATLGQDLLSSCPRQRFSIARSFLPVHSIFVCEIDEKLGGADARVVFWPCGRDQQMSESLKLVSSSSCFYIQYELRDVSEGRVVQCSVWGRPGMIDRECGSGGISQESREECT